MQYRTRLVVPSLLPKTSLVVVGHRHGPGWWRGVGNMVSKHLRAVAMPKQHPPVVKNDMDMTCHLDLELVTSWERQWQLEWHLTAACPQPNERAGCVCIAGRVVADLVSLSCFTLQNHACLVHG